MGPFPREGNHRTYMMDEKRHMGKLKNNGNLGSIALYLKIAKWMKNPLKTSLKNGTNARVW